MYAKSSTWSDSNLGDHSNLAQIFFDLDEVEPAFELSLMMLMMMMMLMMIENSVFDSARCAHLCLTDLTINSSCHFAPRPSGSSSPACRPPPWYVALHGRLRVP